MIVKPVSITHKEATEQYCPLSMARNNIPKNCVGQKCMAWRWRDTKFAEPDYNSGFCGMVSGK